MRKSIFCTMIFMGVVISSVSMSIALFAQTVFISIDDHLSTPPKFAIENLIETLEHNGIKFKLLDEYTLTKKEPQAPLIEIKKPLPPHILDWKKPESFRITVKDNKVSVTGSDSVGLMYGIYELAEQINLTSSQGDAFWEHLQDSYHEPYLEIRADNMFLTLEEDKTISHWFYEEEFWKRYFTMLSRNRFNLCDIHAMYSLTETSFPNLFPYFLKNPEIPQGSLAFEDQEKNLAMLNRIIELAEERGVRVALMNYSMDFPGIDFGDEATLIEQTSWAVSQLLRRCPRLWMFGFRIGESGKSEQFYKVSYLKGIQDSGKKDVRLFTRTWLAQKKDLAQIGMKYPDNFYIEIKYNGEQLGAPYHAIQGRWGSYSYENYLNYPRYWKIIWQIRANGTLRVFPWADVDFVKRCVKTCTFGDAIGFSLEPITAYYPQAVERYFKHPDQVDFIRYQFERHWAWYLVWGRLGYDPDTPETVFIHQFNDKFGDNAGANVYRLLKTSSKIVPLIFQHHCLGPDHRTMAPEMESGNEKRCTTIKSDTHCGERQVCDIDSFITVDVLDPQNFVSIRNYVSQYLANSQDGKVTPLDVAAMLDEFARDCETMLTTVDVGKGKEEWHMLQTDIQALINLACYYAEKNRAACAVQFYYQTGDVSQIPRAGKHIEAAKSYWERLSQVTEHQYRPLLEPLRMKMKNFTWRSEMASLQADRRRVFVLEQEIDGDPELQVGCVPVLQHRPGDDLVLTLGVAGAASPQVKLHFRIDGKPRMTLPCRSVDRWTYQAVIPAKKLHGKHRVKYWFTVSANGKVRSEPQRGHKPYQIILTEDQQRPQVIWRQAETRVDKQKGKVHVECTVSDESGIDWVRLEWKPLPSSQSWKAPLDMTQQGDVFSAEVPLTHEGLLYSIVARDGVTNITRFPDPQKATPYLIVNPWDRGLEPEMRISSPGKISRGLKKKVIAWKDISTMGRPGEFTEYYGNGGQVDYEFTLSSLSDYILTIAKVVAPASGSARILIDGQEVGILDCAQDVGNYIPVQQNLRVSRLTPGSHTLSFRLLDDKPIGIEGFHFEAVPAIIDQFLISQSFSGIIRENGKDMYPTNMEALLWKQAQVGEKGIIHLDGQLKPNEDCYAYAATVLVCPQPIKTYLLVGSNDGVFVWLNGKRIHSYPRKRPFKYNQDRIPVQLKQGENLLVLLVFQAGRFWLFNTNLESYDFRQKLPGFIGNNENE